MEFSFFAATTKIIFDDVSGYHQACENLNKHRIVNEPTRHYADIWPFCLHSRTTRFYRVDRNQPEFTILPAQINVQQLLGENSLFWLFFQERPIFIDPSFNDQTESMKNQHESMKHNTILHKFSFPPYIKVQLNYGALTSINKYCYNPEFNFQDRDQWQVSEKESLVRSYQPCILISTENRDLSFIVRL
jgi:hypothetical protein